MTAAEVATVTDAATLEQIDPASREMAVTQYLADARNKLTLAVAASGPAAVAALKAEIATAAEATKQLGLSKEIQTDAQEMVRRAEYALGKAIRAGQESGDIRTRGQGSKDQLVRDKERLLSPYEFATKVELSGQDGGDGIYAMSDGVDDELFDAAIEEAREDGNLSRANVVRKIKGEKPKASQPAPPAPVVAPTPVEKLVKIREMAPTGMTSGQIAAEIGHGCTEDYVRRIAREHDITITADEVLRGTRRVKVDHNHIVSHLVMTLEVVSDGLERVDFDALDETQTQNWVDSLTTTTRALNRFVKQMKESTQ